jgi:hypothetical protein
VEPFKYALDDLCKSYSSLLFHSIDIIKDLNELNRVKNILFKWLKEGQREIRAKEKVLIENKKNVNSLTYVNELLYNEINENKQRLVSITKEYELLKKDFLGMNKYEQIKQQKEEVEEEFNLYRILVSKELCDLRFDLSKIISERDIFRGELIKLKELLIEI